MADSLNQNGCEMSDPLMLVLIILAILLLLFSGLLTAAEVDYFGADEALRRALSGKKRDRKVTANLAKPERIMATIMIANLVSNVAVIALASVIVLRAPLSLSSGVVFILITAFSVFLFGEILPRLFAVRYPMRAARFMAWPLSFLEIVFRPLNFLFIRSATFMKRNFNKPSQPGLSMSEISQVLELSPENAISEEKEILEGIVNFGNKNVSEIMCPRVDVVAVDIKSSFGNVLELINESGYSRIPVYDGSFDQIRGILYIKDLLPHTDKGENFQWQKMLRLPYFVPETKKIKDLLEDFQKNKIHLAVVVDEYGGSAGIVTLEDVLEEIVGDISDELDVDESFYSRTGENEFLFDGKAELEKFYKIVGKEGAYFEDVKRDADTLAGLILEIKGDIPQQKDTILYRDFRFTIVTITRRRIQKVKVEML